MSAPEGSLTLHGFVLLPDHLQILASLQERYYAAEAEARKARPVVKAGIRREARSSIQSHQEKKDGKKFNTNQKAALSKAVEKWFTLFCKKRTSKDKIGTRNLSGRDVFRMENGKEIQELASTMMAEEGAGKERYVEFYQKALSEMMRELTEDEVQDYAAKAVVWSNMGPPYELRAERGKDIYHNRCHAHARDLYRQGLVRIFSYVAWQTPDGEIWTSKLDFNNEFNGVPRFLDLKRDEIADSGMDALWNDYVMTVYPTDGGDTQRHPHTKGGRKARLLVQVNRYGEPILPNPREPPFGFTGRPWRVDLARAYFSHWYGRAKQLVAANVTVPWSKIIPRLSDFIAPMYLPDTLIKGFLEPSDMIDADVLAVLDHIYARQEQGQDPPFEFHQYINGSGNIVARKARKELTPKEQEIILGSTIAEEEEAGRKSKKKGSKAKSKGKGKEGGEGDGGEDFDDPEKTRLSAGPSKGKGKGKASRSRKAKGKARQTDPPSEGEYIEIGDVSEDTPTQPSRPPTKPSKAGPSRPREPGPSKPGPSPKARTASGSSTRSMQSDNSSDAPRPPTPTLVWSLSKGKKPETPRPASPKPTSSLQKTQTPPPASPKPETPQPAFPKSETPQPASPQPTSPTKPPSTNMDVVVFGSPRAQRNFTFKPSSVVQSNAVLQNTGQRSQNHSDEAEFVDIQVQSHSGNRYTLGSSPTPAPKSIQRIKFKPPIVAIPPFPLLNSTQKSGPSQSSTAEIDDDDLSGYIPGPKSRWKKTSSPFKSQSGAKSSTSSHDRGRASDRGSGDSGDRGSGVNESSKSSQPPKKKQKVRGGGILPTIAETEEGGGSNRDRPKPRPRVVQPEGGDTFDLSRKGRSKARTVETPRRNTSTRSFAGPSSSTRSKTSRGKR